MSVLTRPCGRLPGQELYIKKKESANRPISRPGSQQPYKTYRRPTLIQRVPQMFCIALRSMSRLRFGLDLSTSAGPSHGFGCKVTTYFRYGQRKGKVFSCKFYRRRQKKRTTPWGVRMIIFSFSVCRDAFSYPKMQQYGVYSL